MSPQTHRDPLSKSLLRSGWRAAMLLQTLASTPSSGGHGQARVFYGGARTGNVGGPLVKVKRLMEFFPEHRWRYNLIYLLSNAPYLSPLALNWLRRREIPIVLNQNGVFYPGWYAGDWKAMNSVMAQAYHCADHVFWQSDFCRRAADRFLGPRQGPGEILFNAIDTQKFRPAHSSGVRPFTFLLTGKIDNHLAYRMESTLAGLKVARDSGLDAHLVIAGWIAEAAELSAHALVKRLGIEKFVSFRGPYTQETAPAIYQGADAYVMTKYLDPCPNTVLEAMSCGLPVLYSSSGGVPELVGPQAGVGMPVPESWEATVHTPSPEKIGAGMLQIASQAAVMAVAARSRAEAEFEITRWIDRHRQVFLRLLESRS